MSSTTADDATARAIGETLFARDRASQHLGIRIEEVRLGYARMSMTVLEWMLQGHGVCHGGILFTLADTCMAFASNSHAEVHLALNANIDFLRPAQGGEVLVAEAQETHRTRRTGMYEVSITTRDGSAIAKLRGRTYGTGGAVRRNDA